jgi:hypothetical protein
MCVCSAMRNALESSSLDRSRGDHPLEHLDLYSELHLGLIHELESKGHCD